VSRPEDSSDRQRSFASELGRRAVSVSTLPGTYSRPGSPQARTTITRLRADLDVFASTVALPSLRPAGRSISGAKTHLALVRTRGKWRGVRATVSSHSATSRFRGQGSCCSRRRAMARSRWSEPGVPTSCTDWGVPLVQEPTGTTVAG
jgi:hypothetical protein